jgi:TolA-binding protein
MKNKKPITKDFSQNETEFHSFDIKKLSKLNKLSSKEQNILEKNFDAFDTDAYTGFKETGIGVAGMSMLNSKFGTKSFGKLALVGVSTATVITTISLLAYNSDNIQQIKQAVNTSIHVEKTELITPLSIDSLVSSSNQEKQSKSINGYENLVLEDISVPEILLEPLPTEINEDKKIEFKKTGANIYFSNLKVLDYRLYRSNRTIKIEQIILTGTPADSEQNHKTAQATFENDQERTIEISYHDYLEKTMKFVSKDQWKKALVRFEEIISDYPDDLNARFYGGLCLYNLQKFETASVYFSTCLQLEYANFNEEALWYLALSKKASGQKQESQKLFLQIKSENGFYAQQAEKQSN